MKKETTNTYTPDELLKLNNQLCFPLYVAAREIVNLYRPYLEPLGLTYTQYIVMMVLWEHHDISIRELGATLSLDSGTLTPLLKKMESKNFLRKHRSSKDERVVIVTITSDGEALKKKAGFIIEQMRNRLERFSIEDSNKLCSLLKKLHIAIKPL